MSSRRIRQIVDRLERTLTTLTLALEGERQKALEKERKRAEELEIMLMTQCALGEDLENALERERKKTEELEISLATQCALGEDLENALERERKKTEELEMAQAVQCALGDDLQMALEAQSARFKVPIGGAPGSPEEKEQLIKALWLRHGYRHHEADEYVQTAAFSTKKKRRHLLEEVVYETDVDEMGR